MTANSTGGAPMRLVITLFVLAVLSTAATSFGFSIWDGHQGHNDAALRAIHYNTQYDLSAQWRVVAE